ncbi:MAG: phosphate ABC transporter permease PstA [Actinomycetota bacterium]
MSAVEATAGPGLRTQLHGSRLPDGALWAIIAVAVGFGLFAAVPLGHGPVGFVVVTTPLAIVATWTASRVVEGHRQAANRLTTMLVTVAFALAVTPLVSVLWTVIQLGRARFDSAFFTQTMSGVIGAGGGALHAIAGTLLVTAAAAVISVPIGVLTGVYLVEYGHSGLSRWITMLVDVMTGIPSIVAGLFAFAMFEIFFGPSIRFGIGGAVALSVLMIPIVVRSTEEMLKLVPADLREASYALGTPKWKTITLVVLPAAASGISAGIILAVARIIGETAPLLIIAGTTTALNTNLFSGRMMTLPVFAYSSYMSPGVPPEASIDRAWAAALTLMVLVTILNLVARLIARWLAPKTA